MYELVCGGKTAAQVAKEFLATDEKEFAVSWWNGHVSIKSRDELREELIGLVKEEALMKKIGNYG